MEQKEDNRILLKTSVLVLLLFLVSIVSFLYTGIDFSKPLTGHSIAGSISNAYSEIPLTSKIFLIVQWSLLLLALAFAFIRDRMIVRYVAEIDDFDIDKMSRKSQTDLDVLYELLKDRKQMRVSSVSGLFKISNETAMDWCKILESGNLARIEYPGMGGAIVKAIEKK